jgi:dihydroorotate dehydrogenase
MRHRIVISPPFGHYIAVSWATSIHGTYTYERRPGLLWRSLKTIRPIKDGWVNNIGFRNCGIQNVHDFYFEDIYSVSGIDDLLHWRRIMDFIPHLAQVEANAGCPNVHDAAISLSLLRDYRCRFSFVSLKIPPTDKAEQFIHMASEANLNAVHISNTLPSPRGGQSGSILKPHSLKWVERAKEINPDMKIIAGGGIYEPQDVIDYHNAGADCFSLATIWLTPWRVRKVVKQIKALDK